MGVDTQERVDIMRLLKFDELTGILKGFVERFPKLASLDSMGKSHEGRDIWVLNITNQETGAAEEKPAMYIDGNIHAGEVTGYPCASVYDAFPEFDERGRRSTSGGFIEWTYEHLGMFSFATELWDLQSRAGIDRPANDAMRVVREQTEEDGLKQLKFNDESLDGEGFEPWRAFEHPQLGKVELGGWKSKQMRQNAPPQFLRDECECNAAFTLRQAAMTSRLTVSDVEVEKMAEDLFVVRAMVANDGYLPSNGSAMAVRNNIARPVEVEIEGAEVVMGKPKQEIGHLMGRSANRGMLMMFGMAKVENERLVEWLVRGSGPVTIIARSACCSIRG